MCVCDAHIHRHTCAIAQAWESEDRVWNPVLFSHHRVLGQAVIRLVEGRALYLLSHLVGP